jgi:glycerol-3-phosphate dehydrogenase
MPSPLIRDLQALATRTFDVLVVGGGIYGLTVACDAAQRGLAVALVERNDFGSGTSFNHLRTIHGGLRYLQTLDLARARESVRERRTIARIAPWAVQPLPFVLPLTRSLTRGPAAMRAGFFLDRLVAANRNDGVPESHRMPPGRVVSRDDARRAWPDLHSMEFDTAAVWYDYVTVEADRLTFAWALGAAAHGAQLANYVEVEALTADAGHVTGAQLVDRISGEALQLKARAVINATGGAINRLLMPFGAAVRVPLLQAMNVVTSRSAPSVAVGGRSASGRNLFLVPWRGRALFGTWESSTVCDSDALGVRDEDLRSFLAELNQAFPSYGLRPDEVTLVHRGVVPARLRADGTPVLEGHELVFDHSAGGLRGTISVAGTKYTTARAVAERIVDRVFSLLDRPDPGCVSASTALPHVALEGQALLAHAAANEMVVTLADAVMRRTTLGALGIPDAAELLEAASVVGGILGWSSDRQRDEIAALGRMY